MSTKNNRAGRERAPTWQLRVYVANWKTRSALTAAHLECLCAESIPGRYHIQIVDLLQTPERCTKDRIVAIPTGVRHYPLPERRAIGTLSDEHAVRLALELGVAESGGRK
jgi:circadian clock protein KaiB